MSPARAFPPLCLLQDICQHFLTPCPSDIVTHYPDRPFMAFIATKANLHPRAVKRNRAKRTAAAAAEAICTDLASVEFAYVWALYTPVLTADAEAITRAMAHCLRALSCTPPHAHAHAHTDAARALAGAVVTRPPPQRYISAACERQRQWYGALRDYLATDEAPVRAYGRPFDWLRH